MRVLVCLAVIAMGSAAAPAAAQSAPDFSQLHVNVGDKVYVTDMTTGGGGDFRKYRNFAHCRPPRIRKFRPSRREMLRPSP